MPAPPPHAADEQKPVAPQPVAPELKPAAGAPAPSTASAPEVKLDEKKQVADAKPNAVVKPDESKAAEAKSAEPKPANAAQPKVADGAKQDPANAGAAEAGAVLPAAAEPIVRTTTMAGAKHTLRADPTTGKVEFNSVAGFAVEKLQSVVDLVPQEARQTVTNALALAVEVAALVTDVALQAGAKESARTAVLQRVTVKLDSLASAIRVFGDTGQITDADPGVIQRARADAEKKAAAAADAKKQAETKMEAATNNAAKEPAPAPPVANAPANANASAAGGLATPPPAPAPAPVVAKKPEPPKQIPVPSPAMSVTNGPTDQKPGNNISPDQQQALQAQQPDIVPVDPTKVWPNQVDNLKKPDAASSTNPDGKSAADAGKQDFEKRALAFEKKLGAHAFGHSKATTAVNDMVGQCKAYLTTIAGKWDKDSAKLKTVLAQCGDDNVNYVGAVGKEIHAVMNAFDASAPMQVKWHHILHFFEHHLVKELAKATSDWDPKFVEALQNAEMDANALKARRKEVASDDKALPAKAPVPGEKTDWSLMHYDVAMAGQGHTRVKEKGGADGTLGQTPAQLGVEMSPDEVAFQKKAAAAEKDKAAAEGKPAPAHGGDFDPKTMAPRWSSGSKGWMMNERDAWVRRQREMGLPLAAGPSGHTTCMMNAGIYFKQDIFALRLAAIGNLLVFGHHSLVEVLTAAQSFGAPFTPGETMYTDIKPLEGEELKALGGGSLPHEPPSEAKSEKKA